MLSPTCRAKGKGGLEDREDMAKVTCLLERPGIQSQCPALTSVTDTQRSLAVLLWLHERLLDDDSSFVGEGDRKRRLSAACGLPL